MEEEAQTYCKMLKEKLLDNNQEDKYREFRNIMRSFRLNKIGPESVISRVQALFDGQNDLIAGFNRFLPHKHAETIDGDDDRGASTGSINVVCSDPKPFHKGRVEVPKEPDDKHDVAAKKKSAVEFINRVRKILEDDVIFREALDVMAGYKTHKDLDCVDKKLSALFKATPELHIEFTQFAADAMAKQSALEEINHEPKKNRFNAIKPKGLIEQKMNWCEDYMFEHDVLFHWVLSATQSMEKLREACEKNEIGTTTNVEAFLSPINLRCVEFLYGDHGLEILDILRENPGPALRVILPRLRRQLEKLKIGRSEAVKLIAKKMKLLHGRTDDEDELIVNKNGSSGNVSNKSRVAEAEEINPHENNVEVG